MIKLEGIIYKAFENFIVFRGYAPIGILSKVSKRPEAYQRTADETHKRDIINPTFTVIIMFYCLSAILLR